MEKREDTTMGLGFEGKRWHMEKERKHAPDSGLRAGDVWKGGTNDRDGHSGPEAWAWGYGGAWRAGQISILRHYGQCDVMHL